MRLKGLSVLLIAAFSVFVLLYWVTDDARRQAIAVEQDHELLEFGELVFSEDPSQLAAAGCARCHGAEGEGGAVPNDPNGRQAPSLRTRTLADKVDAYLRNTGNSYVEVVVRNGGVAVSGDVNSPMPAWGQTLNDQQIDAVVALVESWALEAAEEAPEEFPDTVEGGQQVFTAAGCAGCHGANLEGGVGPNLQTIGSELVTEGLPVPPADLDQMIADYEEDPALFLENWIRDSWNNYNDGVTTQMPQYPEDTLSENNLRALITFLLAQTGE